MKPSIRPEEPGTYAVTAESVDGPVTITLILDGCQALSDDRLSDDEATAAAVIDYLLSRQDAVDLPRVVEFEQVVAAYPEAVDQVAQRRR